MPTAEPVLRVTGLATGYGPMQVVHGVDFAAVPGEVRAIVGRNGAGKTTSLLTIAGVRRGRTSGTVVLAGKDISRESARAIVVSGLAVVPEGHPLFGDLTVMENLLLGASTRRRAE